MTAMAAHAVVIAGGGPTGLIVAGELALAGADPSPILSYLTHLRPGSAPLRDDESNFFRRRQRAPA